MALSSYLATTSPFSQIFKGMTLLKLLHPDLHTIQYISSYWEVNMRIFLQYLHMQHIPTYMNNKSQDYRIYEHMITCRDSLWGQWERRSPRGSPSSASAPLAPISLPSMSAMWGWPWQASAGCIQERIHRGKSRAQFHHIFSYGVHTLHQPMCHSYWIKQIGKNTDSFYMYSQY